MIVFDLKCDHDHVFEIWFRSSADYEDQKARSLISCPICGSVHVEKAVMAPNVGTKSNQKSVSVTPTEKPQPEPESTPAAVEPPSVPSAKAPETPPQSQAAMMPEVAQARAFLRAINEHVKSKFENVGDKFASEARAMHYGDAEERGIYGNASKEDVEDLLDEGIEILPLPDEGKTDA